MTLTPATAPTVHVDIILNLPTEDGGTFRVRQGIGGIRTQTEGLVVFPAVYGPFDIDESEWHVFHVGTGQRIPVAFDDEQQATAFANAAGPLAVWSQKRPKLAKKTRVELLQLAQEHGCRPDQRIHGFLARNAAKTNTIKES